MSAPEFGLLRFESYAEYLQSFQYVEDHRYIGNLTAINKLVRLGYRNTGRVYTEEEFDKNKLKSFELINPKIVVRDLSDKWITMNDPGLRALAERERPNLLKKLSTIIFICARMPSGFDVSSYMDYAMNLRHFEMDVRGAPNWNKIFNGTQKLMPKPSDLSYYDMRKKLVTHNDSDNYITLAMGNSLVFLHRGDHKIIIPDGKGAGNTFKKVMILSPSLGSIILYDHVVRKPL
ncbi:hypothetical protein KR093_006403 [Drosophila rubida]|uniref:Cilia- and flagella-associated protein 299 n=1 Tax=Drosophila rubida TaxID=30044 RepID=A0AAD4PNM3_9MUSC|nr:hypothetical protein KR093_006403 [Drosophila rubida]